MELAAWDHTATTDMKIFTRCADDLLGAAFAVQPGASVPSRQVRQRKWRLRFTIAYEEACSSNADVRRPARNYLQVAHVQRTAFELRGLAEAFGLRRSQAQTAGGLQLQCSIF